jgi:hypothetical protein
MPGNFQNRAPGRRTRAVRRPRRTALNPRASGRHHFRRSVAWTATTFAAAIIGVIVSLNIDAIRSWSLSKESIRDPLEVSVMPNSEMPDGAWRIVVPDPTRLPTDTSTIKDCDTLWKVGLTAGGIESRSSTHLILLQGKANNGVVITQMEARITKRQPAIPGALLECVRHVIPPAGILAIHLDFNLNSTDTAAAKYFDKGHVISIAKDEPVLLATEVTLPDSAAYWHIEAKILVAGKTRTLVIDNAGKDFSSPGTRTEDDYGIHITR